MQKELEGKIKVILKEDGENIDPITQRKYMVQTSERLDKMSSFIPLAIFTVLPHIGICTKEEFETCRDAYEELVKKDKLHIITQKAKRPLLLAMITGKEGLYSVMIADYIYLKWVKAINERVESAEDIMPGKIDLFQIASDVFIEVAREFDRKKEENEETKEKGF